MTLQERHQKDKAQALQMLRAGLQAGMLYNVDYTFIKQSLNWALDDEYDAAMGYKTPLYHAIRSLYLSQPFVHTIAGHRKKIAKLHPSTPGLPEFLTFLEEWCTIGEEMKTAQGLITKARKPSGKERVTPERTLDNTGTCAICMRNVKLKGGRMYDHGFTLQWHARNGNCFGVGEPPWELSPEGAKKYLVELRKDLVEQQRALGEADSL